MFANRLSKVLSDYKISMYKLSKELKLNKQTVINWCTGIYEPKASQIAIICRYLDVSADYLLGLTD
ncbi:MAG: helix-turn-helix domain-containing protein [Corallococcus sp.]|nr:helix-turn-helix domain-containing protein [Corallococcus sp.]